MDKNQARSELSDILEKKMLQDPDFKETIVEGQGFVDSNLADILALGNGSWDAQLAQRHIAEMQETLLERS